MTIYTKKHIRDVYEALLPACATDHEAAVEATADRLGISTNDVLEALSPETEQC